MLPFCHYLSSSGHVSLYSSILKKEDILQVTLQWFINVILQDIINIAKERRKKQNLKPPSLNWFKWDIDAYQIETKKATKIRYICRDNQGKIYFCMEKPINNCPIHVAETLRFVRQFKWRSRCSYPLPSLRVDSQIAI